MSVQIARTSWRVVALLQSTLLLGVIALLSWTTPALAAAPGYSIGVAPTPGSKDLAGSGSYFAPTVAPGGTFTGSVLLANGNANPVSVDVYPVDGLTSPNSGTAYSNAGQTIVGAGAWVSIANNEVTMAPLTRTNVTFTVHVPSGAAPGDHLAGVAIEGVRPKASASGHLQVQVLTRSVIGVLIVVPGAATFNLSMATPTISAGTYGIGQVTTTLTDTGGLLGKPILTLTMSNSSGYSKIVTRALNTMLPGDAVPVNVYWPDPLKGSYTVSVCARGGGLASAICTTGTGNIASATKTPKTGTTQFTPTPATKFPLIWVVVGGALAAIIFLGGGITFGMRVSKRHVLAGAHSKSKS